MNSEIFLAELNEILQRPINSTEFLSQVTDIQVDLLNYQNKRRKLKELGKLIAIDLEFERKEAADLSDTKDFQVDLSDIFDTQENYSMDASEQTDQKTIAGELDDELEVEECVEEGIVNSCGDHPVNPTPHSSPLELVTMKVLSLPKKDNGIYIAGSEKCELSPKEDDHVCPTSIVDSPRQLHIVPELSHKDNTAVTIQLDRKRKETEEFTQHLPLPPSMLDRRQHQFYLECLNNNQFLQNNMTKFKEIDEIVKQERFHYAIISQAILSINRSVFEKLSVRAEDFYRMKLTERFKRVSEDYNMNMQCIKCIDMEKDYTRGNVLQYKETLLKLGICGKVSRNINVKLNAEIQKISPPVMTMDLNLEMLLKDNDIDIAMSSSSLNALISAVADSPGFEIPIVIKIVQQRHKATKVILFDKSLAMTKQTCRDKMQKYYKNALKQFNKEKGELWYNVWKFGKFNILLRTRQESQMEIDGQIRNVNPQVKLEYLPSTGQEVITEYEKIKWWASTFIKPNATLMLASVHPETDTIIDNQEKRMDQLIEDGNFPIPYTNGLYEIFNELQRLQPGMYYIAKKQRGKKISIFETTSTKTKYFPNELIITGNPVTPMPMYKWREAHIPYTFPPNDFAPTGKIRLPFKERNAKAVSLRT